MPKKIEVLSPENYTKALLSRKLELERALKSQKAVIDRLSSQNLFGHIRIVRHYNQLQFYHITKKGDTKGKYLPKNKNDFAKNLVRLQYEQKAVVAMQTELRLIKQLLLNNQKNNICYVFNKLSKLRQSIITPITLPTLEYSTQWQNIPYTPNSFEHTQNQYYTAKKEQVRSKSEVIIADTLNRMNIPYHYEFPLELKNRAYPIYPDFHCLNSRTRQEFYWEHFGMMDIPEYAAKAVAKINLLSENGYSAGKNVIFTFENSESQVDTRIIEKMIQIYLI